MKRIFTSFSVILLLLLTPKTYSQIVWTFSNGVAVPSYNSYAPGLTAGAMTSNNNTLPKSGVPPVTLTTTSASSGYFNNSGTYNLGAAADTGTLRPDSSAYFEFTLTPASALSGIIIASIRFGMRSTSTGPTNISIRTSNDNYFTDFILDTINVPAPGGTAAWTTKNYLALSVTVTAPLTVRIYGYGSTSTGLQKGTINWRIDDVTINNTVLPVTLGNFTASIVSNKVQLNWSAASEVNLKGYSVEKSSDGKTFSEVSYIAASGKGSYSVQDAVSSSAVYYRLKMVNNDGSFTYSKNIPVNASVVSSSALRIYPNPVVTTAMVSHPSAGANASLKVTDLNGRVLQSYALQTGAVQTQINAGKLLSGTYLVVYHDANGSVVSARLVKQ